MSCCASWGYSFQELCDTAVCHGALCGAAHGQVFILKQNNSIFNKFLFFLNTFMTTVKQKSSAEPSFLVTLNPEFK
jgi:hypothetical protein